MYLVRFSVLVWMCWLACVSVSVVVLVWWGLCAVLNRLFVGLGYVLYAVLCCDMGRASDRSGGVGSGWLKCN